MPFIETARCDGRCCRGFVVPVIHEMGGLDAFRAYNAETEAMDPDERWEKRRRQFKDAAFIVDMLVIKDDGTVEVCPLSGEKLGMPHEHYGCRHWNEATGDCSVYETRPHMCREWPGNDWKVVVDVTGGACAMEGCTRRGRYDPDVVRSEDVKDRAAPVTKELTHDAP